MSPELYSRYSEGVSLSSNSKSFNDDTMTVVNEILKDLNWDFNSDENSSNQNPDFGKGKTPNLNLNPTTNNPNQKQDSTPNPNLYSTGTDPKPNLKIVSTPYQPPDISLLGGTQAPQVMPAGNKQMKLVRTTI
uniref:Uncharacterized protein n=1 Tax=Cacopsylla melanoneura TaxID=428564 RepID=A0A8D8TAA1_9HEMI